MNPEPYEGRLFRPPSEAHSLILQVTVGCSHNQCTFCSMYKEKTFKIKPLEEVLRVIESYTPYAASVTKVFIADGDALVLPMAYWEPLLEKLNQTFPNLKRVSAYGTPLSVLRQSVESLEKLKKLGLSLVYMGLESGSEPILKNIQKGVTPEEMIQAGNLLKASGIQQSITVISGLGGKALWEEHALETAKVLNAINPEFIGLLTLMIEAGVPLSEQIRTGEFELLSAEEVLKETLSLLTHLEVTHCTFRSNHASNYLPLAGELPQDQERLVNELHYCLSHGEELRAESSRRL